jgi:phosphatidylserine decarboxylase
MEQSDTFIVAKEAWKYLAAAAGAYVVFLMADLELFQFATFAGVLALLYIYRNPERIVPYYQESSIVSVADGRVVSIETVDDCPMIQGPCYRVDITSSTFDASLLRMPFEAVVRHLHLRRGSRLSIHKPLARKLNEKAVLFFEDEKGQQCVVEHILDKSIDALSLHARHEQRLPQGSRYGLMVKGNHTLYFPAESRVAVKVGDEVRAGETLLGYFS